jgi:hypothetical protein
MTDRDYVDIVTMLRSPDRFEPYTCNAAADEIERLRGDRETMLSLLGTIADIRDAAGVGDRAMLGELAERIKHLRAERDQARQERDGFLDGNRMTLKALAEANEIAGKCRAERDEARRLYINEMCLRDYGDTSARITEAKARGWNCFDGDGWSDPGDECQREAL